MTHEEICTYEVCKLAKDKGFAWGCLYHYDAKGSLHQHYAYDAMNSGVVVDDLLMYDGHLYTSECLAPTQSLLKRWLREEKGYYVYPYFDNVQLMWDWVCREKTGDKWIPLVRLDLHLFPTYELALEDALKYALENLI